MQGLEVRNLSKRFGGLVVSENIDFDLPPGSRKALIGPNGAGKSTFANLVTGILAPSAGTIRFDGQDIAGMGEARRVKLGIAKTFQITTLFPNLTVRENLRLPVLEREGRGFRLFRRADGDPEVEAEVQALIDQFDLGPLADQLGGLRAPDDPQPGPGPVGALAGHREPLERGRHRAALHPARGREVVRR